MQAKKIGYLGEELAASYLNQHGYSIVATNYTIQGGEIDIIARCNDFLIFVEVKTRTSSTFGNGGESITRNKRLRLQRAITHYIAQHCAHREPEYRIDVIEITLHAQKHYLLNIDHIENIE
ncbi:YraN family protein [Candidatus Peregrinibacteria bacterium CG11_big_fil_rev_8_21_14_0_20_46_8]|nr:MAG: YraN family protein [Candidatus Peregrinibacteria bacterium CG11_big_fil_rev_8_21_14_0_20_46_8]